VDVVQRFLILLLIYGTDVPAEQNENIIFVESFVALIDRDPSRSMHAGLAPEREECLCCAASRGKRAWRKATLLLLKGGQNLNITSLNMRENLRKKTNYTRPTRVWLKFVRYTFRMQFAGIRTK